MVEDCVGLTGDTVCMCDIEQSRNTWGSKIRLINNMEQAAQSD
jgi:hypothetical protein